MVQTNRRKRIREEHTENRTEERMTRRQRGNESGLYGAEEARTPDLFNAIEALSQLSYSPTMQVMEYAGYVLLRHDAIILQSVVLCKGNSEQGRNRRWVLRTFVVA